MMLASQIFSGRELNTEKSFQIENGGKFWEGENLQFPNDHCRNQNQLKSRREEKPKIGIQNWNWKHFNFPYFKLNTLSGHAKLSTESFLLLDSRKQFRAFPPWPLGFGEKYQVLAKERARDPPSFFLLVC